MSEKNLEPTILVSCIIPTFNRAESLKKTLLSLLEQDFDPTKYEIIVVDNNSTDNTKEVVQKISAQHRTFVKYHLETRQGVHYARNSAFTLSRGDILYYTDDDMEIDRSVLQSLLRVFEFDPRIAVATGKVLPIWESEPPKWFRQHCSNALVSLNEREEELIISSSDPGVYSCHQAIRREVLEIAGGFNPELLGNVYLGDGETGLNIKVKKRGHLFAYVGSAIVYHHIPNRRMTQTYLNLRMYNQGNADSYTYYREYRPQKSQLWGQIMRHLLKIMRAFLSLLRRFFFFSSYWHLSLARIFYFIARVKYDFKLLRDKEFQGFVLRDNWLVD